MAYNSFKIFEMTFCQMELNDDEWYWYDINHITGSAIILFIESICRFVCGVCCRMHGGIRYGQFTPMNFVKHANFSKSRFLTAYNDNKLNLPERSKLVVYRFKWNTLDPIIQKITQTCSDFKDRIDSFCCVYRGKWRELFPIHVIPWIMCEECWKRPTEFISCS